MPEQESCVNRLCDADVVAIKPKTFRGTDMASLLWDVDLALINLRPPPNGYLFKSLTNKGDNLTALSLCRHVPLQALPASKGKIPISF
jgi:hypothetical protein